MRLRSWILLSSLVLLAQGCDEAIYRRLSGNERAGTERAEAKQEGRGASDTGQPAGNKAGARIPDGYLKTRFGMSAKRVMDIYERAYSRQEGLTLMFVHHKARAPKEDLKFSFLEDRLYKVVHTRREPSSEKAKAVYEKLLKTCAQAYGPGGNSSGNYWNDGARDMKILCRGSLVTVSVRDIAADHKAQKHLAQRAGKYKSHLPTKTAPRKTDTRKKQGAGG